MNKNKKEKVVKDYGYWKMHKVVFEELFWNLDQDIRKSIADNPYCREAKVFEKRLDKAVSDKLKLTAV
jgi:hypothetical protein